MNDDEIVRYIQMHDAPAVLASLVATEGHSYRKRGAAMLFFEGGALGSLSPGCLESDLALRLPEVWASGAPERVEYDMRTPDDFAWGEAVGCGGKLTVMLEPVKGELRKVLLEAAEWLGNGDAVMLERSVSGWRYEYRLTSGAPEAAAAAGVVRAATAAMVPPETEEVPGADAVLPVFATRFAPKPRLILFGGGLDAVPIAELAARSGFRVVWNDWREGAAAEGIYAAERVICHPNEAAAKLAIGGGDYVLVCSHQTQRDRQFLKGALAAAPRYIGIVGSRARIALLLEGMETPASVHAPVGLAIGAEGPEEIAVSIIAEMIQERRKRAKPLVKGEECDENSRDLSGGGPEPSHGRIQSIADAARGGAARKRRAQ
ncbi:XdhC family protein [Paenibacillus sp. NFR01]|uniref:XdhC family protein n=1 Tax=Paenibacillus sp. NFR01 TaxID=1566279 RepID=UPI0008BC3132|nr:XdhC/CoxI family protein [Paenibacillus sp. NFR01]SET92256.1 xanthine dehydrogenase accessory factor [Paenibacillus sp. NFR01]